MCTGPMEDPARNEAGYFCLWLSLLAGKALRVDLDMVICRRCFSCLQSRNGVNGMLGSTSCQSNRLK